MVEGGAEARLQVPRRDRPLRLARVRQRRAGGRVAAAGRAGARVERADCDGFTVLAGTEVNINIDGSLDYPDEVLEELDWIVASAHTSFRMGEDEMTKRMMAAMDHPLVDVIGHPTGRKILQREPYAVNVEQLVAHAAGHGHVPGDQRQPRPARPERRARSPRGGGRRADRDQLRRAQHAHAERDPLRRRDRAPRMAHEGARREHAHVAAARQAAESARAAPPATAVRR